MTDPSRLDRPNGDYVAYHKTEGNAPTVMFCGGFMSDMTGTKATTLEDFCRARGQGFVRFDYRGHGVSSGRFEDGTIGDWTNDAIAIIDDVTEGPLIIVGSSMGGWIMLLAALARKERVQGLVGVAAAPDFTSRMLSTELTEAQREELSRTGQTAISSDYDERPYIITQDLILDGNARCLLTGPIDLNCPIRLLHGMKDEAVPWQSAMAILELTKSDDVSATYIKNGDHRLSEPSDLARLCAAVAELSALGEDGA